MIVSQSKFLILSYFTDTKTIKVDWQATSEDMTEEDFKAQVHLENDAFLKYRPENILGQTQKLLYGITPEEQDWHNEIILATFREVGLHKLAIVVSEDIFAQVSVGQILDSDNNSSYRTNYFNDEASALAWIAAK